MPTPPTRTNDYAGHMTGGFHEGTQRDARTQRGSRETLEKRSDRNTGSGTMSPTGPADPARVNTSNDGASA